MVKFMITDTDGRHLRLKIDIQPTNEICLRKLFPKFFPKYCSNIVVVVVATKVKVEVTKRTKKNIFPKRKRTKLVSNNIFLFRIIPQFLQIVKLLQFYFYKKLDICNSKYKLYCATFSNSLFIFGAVTSRIFIF